jgi:uncharacterized protein DUF202
LSGPSETSPGDRPTPAPGDRPTPAPGDRPTPTPGERSTSAPGPSDPGATDDLSDPGAADDLSDPGAAHDLSDPGLARDRSALAWTRSALNMAASGTLLARGAFTAHLVALGVVCAIAMAGLALLTWRHGQALYRERYVAGVFPSGQSAEFVLLTTATVLTATAAVVVSIAI